MEPYGYLIAFQLSLISFEKEPICVTCSAELEMLHRLYRLGLLNTITDGCLEILDARLVHVQHGPHRLVFRTKAAPMTVSGRYTTFISILYDNINNLHSLHTMEPALGLLIFAFREDTK